MKKILATIMVAALGLGAWGAAQTVAKIGDTEYKSLQDAVNKVTTGQTINLVADCDETALVARIVSFTLVVDAGKNFTGSIAQGSGETVIATSDDGNGGTVYTMTQPNRSYTYFTSVNNANTYDPLILAYVKKEWEKTQTGVFIAGRKVRASGTYDGEGYPDAEGKVSVDLENRTITLNNATITASSAPLTTYTRVSTLRGTSVEKVLHNEVPYDGVVCIEEMKYNVPSSSAERGNSAGFCYWPIGYSKGNGLMATVGLAILDENAWTVNLVGDSKIVVNAGFVCPTSTGNVPNLSESGDGYGIYAKGTLTVQGSGTLDANVKNTGVSDYDYSINPGTAGVFAQNLTISETTISATVEGVDATMNIGGNSITGPTSSKYGAVYASDALTITDSNIAATNKMSYGRNGWVSTSGAAIGSVNGSVTISGGDIDAQHSYSGYGYDDDYNMVTVPMGSGIAATGTESSTVTITGGADVSVEAGASGVYGYRGVTVNGTATKLDVESSTAGISAQRGPYLISQADVKVDAPASISPAEEGASWNGGSSISTGVYSAEVPAFAVAEGNYEITEEGLYRITDTPPANWVAYYDKKFYMSEDEVSDVIAACEEGGEVYLNVDSAVNKVGIGDGKSVTIYVLQGKSYTGSVTTDKLLSTETVGDAVTFEGNSYVPHTFTMSADPSVAVARVDKADGTTRYFASLATTYGEPSYVGALNDLADGDKVVLLADAALSAWTSQRCSWTLDLNGHVLTADGFNNLSVNRTYTLTIVDSSSEKSGAVRQTTSSSQSITVNGIAVVYGGTFSGAKNPIYPASGTNYIHGGYFDGPLATGSKGTYLIDGGTFTVDPSAYVVERYEAVKTSDTEWTVQKIPVPCVTNSVQAANCFGAVKITGNVASNMYVAVPFEGFESAGAARKAKDVVHPANLTAETKMYVYNKTSDSHDVYKVASGAWAPAVKVTINSNNAATLDAASLDRAVPAGTGVLVARANAGDNVYVYGQIPGAAVNPEPFAKGQTFVAPPYTNATVEVSGVKYIDLNASKWTDVAAAKQDRKLISGADFIQFRDASNRLIKFYYDGTSWGLQPTYAKLASYKPYVEGGKALVPQGTAFWYCSSVGGAKVEWK